jgi:hypothetical protein
MIGDVEKTAHGQRYKQIAAAKQAWRSGKARGANAKFIGKIGDSGPKFAH